MLISGSLSTKIMPDFNITERYNVSEEEDGVVTEDDTKSFFTYKRVSTIIVCFILLVGCVANSLLVITMYRQRKNMRRIYVLILNLTIADLISISFSITNQVTVFLPEWPFGWLGCKLIISGDILAWHASAFTLVLMAGERMYVILFPFKIISMRDLRSAFIGCSITWILASLVTTPNFVYGELLTQRGYKQCIFSDIDIMKRYFTLVFVTSYLGPGLVISLFYGIILVRLWCCSSIPHLSNQKKITKMVFCIILVFWMCLLPFWVCYLLSFYVPSYKHIILVWKLSIAATYLIPTTNPFIYFFWRNKAMSAVVTHPPHLHLPKPVKRAKTLNPGCIQATTKAGNFKSAQRCQVDERAKTWELAGSSQSNNTGQGSRYPHHHHSDGCCHNSHTEPSNANCEHRHSESCSHQTLPTCSTATNLLEPLNNKSLVINHQVKLLPKSNGYVVIFSNVNKNSMTTC